MKQLKKYIIEKLHISNYKKEKEEEINLKIFKFKNDFVNVDLKDCNDDDFNEVVNSEEGIYDINFEVNGYGEFYGIINIPLFGVPFILQYFPTFTITSSLCSKIKSTKCFII